MHARSGQYTSVMQRKNHFHLSCLRKLIKIELQDKIPDTDVLAKAQVGPGLCFGPEFGVRVRSSEKELSQTWFGGFDVRRKNGSNQGSASSKFGERMGPILVRQVRSSGEKRA